MTAAGARFGILASTGGAVLGQLLESRWFRRHVALVAADRPCGALARADAAGVPRMLCASDDAEHREARLAAAFEQHAVDHVFVFYTRLLRHELLTRFGGRLWNLHPSRLPEFPGRHGFEDGYAAGVPMLGATLHAIDAGTDTGPLLSQSAFTRTGDMTMVHARHAVFSQQVRMTLQAGRWLDADRVQVAGGRVVLRDAPPAALHDGAVYSPGLEDIEARTLALPVPHTTEVPR